jgi:predicted nucleotidyltransferase
VNLDEIRALGARLAELCRKYGIAELAVFGSVARGDAGPDSDVDLLYVRVPGNDLGMAYFDLQEDPERLFGRRVDLVAKDGLHRVIRDQVLDGGDDGRPCRGPATYHLCREETLYWRSACPLGSWNSSTELQW